MNVYRTEFFAECPSNGIRIKYAMRIETPATQSIPVEHILQAVKAVEGKALFHEQIADEMYTRIPGRITLTAEHHGVTIETERP